MANWQDVMAEVVKEGMEREAKARQEVMEALEKFLEVLPEQTDEVLLNYLCEFQGTSDVVLNKFYFHVREEVKRELLSRLKR